MERRRHVAELPHRRDRPRLRREAVVAFRNPAMPTGMAGHLIVRSGQLWRFEYHHGQRRPDFRGPVFIPEHCASRRLPCLAIQSGGEALQNGRSWVRRERERQRVWQTGEVEC